MIEISCAPSESVTKDFANGWCEIAKNQGRGCSDPVVRARGLSAMDCRAFLSVFASLREHIPFWERVSRKRAELSWEATLGLRSCHLFIAGAFLTRMKTMTESTAITIATGLIGTAIGIFVVAHYLPVILSPGTPAGVLAFARMAPWIELPLLAGGSCAYCQAKGYSFWLGLFGVTVMGFFILMLLPDRDDEFED